MPSKKLSRLGKVVKYILAPMVLVSLIGLADGAPAGVLQIVTELGTVKGILSQVGPLLSGVLFVVAGVFYAVGQMMPPDKRANFHTTAINMIIGAVVVGVLSFASTSLANASTHLLSNVTANSA